jgi:hypothetical protein
MPVDTFARVVGANVTSAAPDTTAIGKVAACSHPRSLGWIVAAASRNWLSRDTSGD